MPLPFAYNYNTTTRYCRSSQSVVQCSCALAPRKKKMGGVVQKGTSIINQMHTIGKRQH